MRARPIMRALSHGRAPNSIMKAGRWAQHQAGKSAAAEVIKGGARSPNATRYALKSAHTFGFGGYRAGKSPAAMRSTLRKIPGAM